MRNSNLKLQDDLLLQIVKADHLVKEHQVEVVEMFLILCVQLQVGFGVFDKIIGEVAHQTAGEGGKALNFRAFVFRHDPTQDFAACEGITVAEEGKTYEI